MGGFAYSGQITANQIRVTFNGTEYICEKKSDEFNNEYYGANEPSVGVDDWSEYPFRITSGTGGLPNGLHTENAGTYQVKIEAFEETVEASECFGKAVKSIMSQNPSALIVRAIDYAEDRTTYDKTFAEVDDAFASGKPIYIYDTNFVRKVVISSEVLATEGGEEFRVKALGEVNSAVAITTYRSNSRDSALYL